MRSMTASIIAALLLAASPALADNKSDCMQGIRSVKAQMKQKHPQPARDEAAKALAKAEDEVVENDWGECVDFVNRAKSALKKK
jgi:hypothetical protein